MARKLQIPGNEASAATRSAKSAELKIETQEDLPFDIQLQKVVDVSSARDTDEQVTVPLESPPTQGEARTTGQIAEVELEDGIKLWMRVGSLYRDFGAPGSRGMTQTPGDDVWAIAPTVARPLNRNGARSAGQPTAVRRITIYKWRRTEPASAAVEPPTGAASRGLADGAQGAATDSVVGLGLTFVADKVADKVGRRVEKFMHGRETPIGLYRLDLSGALAPQRVERFDTGDATKPILLFIHGTMSSFNGSFGGLWTKQPGVAARADLARRFGHAYAFQHYTLTESPIDNALAIAQLLPPGAKLHLVTHSRGGLVGDLLCLGQREPWVAPPDSSPFSHDDSRIDAEYKRQEANFRRLFELLATKQIHVERYVRAACPSRGTTLASKRLDRWLSIFKLLGELHPAVKLPLEFLLALIAEHDDPTNLPGLEAQMPGSPLIQTLNLPQLRARADLTVISGDTESTGWLGRVKEFALDQFFEDESDIIVNTGAMYGGVTRIDGGRFHPARGPAVNHFSYFDNPETVAKVVEGLLRLDGSDIGFQPLSEAKQKEPVARAVFKRAALGPRPIVFILPGIMGSHLSIADQRIWMAIGRLMLGGLAELQLNGAKVTADFFLEDYYEELAQYLSQTHEVERFPYDWRRSVLDAGVDLATRIGAKLDQLERSKQPVRVIAHSMGGLVVRAMIASRPAVWRRMMAHSGSRFIMLGTPNGGSHEILRLLTGRARTLHQLALLDLRRGAGTLLNIISKFPGVLELLPTADEFNCFKPQFWRDLKQDDKDTLYEWWQSPPDAALLEAERTRQFIENAEWDLSKTVYVAGAAPATPVDWRLQTEFDYEGGRTHWQTIQFTATAEGDGQVPWATGIPRGMRAYYLKDVVHGDLAAHAPAFAGYLELLETGGTSWLPTSPAATRGPTAAKVFDMPLQLPSNLPDSRDLAASLVGARPPRKTRALARLPKTRVSITHGDLVFARNPVAVGHYRGDTIVSAERFLDGALDHQLRERLRLDLYPGEHGTFEVFIQTDRFRKPAGAIVIGLGQVGELSPGRLTSSFARAALGHALQVKECADDRFGGATGAPRHARISALLIGTGAGGITVRDSVEAILRGVASASRRLHDIDLSDEVWIDELEFVEVYQDIAIAAAGALEKALLDGELESMVDWPERCIREGQGGRRRALFGEAADWWHRLEIVHDKNRDELRFISLTDRARAEETLAAGQRKLADDFIQRAIFDSTYKRGLSRTLFEILIPNRLKEAAPDEDKLVLIVDDVSGAYPWELLEDRWSVSGKPVAVRAGLLRQLKTAAFRERPATPVSDTAYVVGNPALPAMRDDFRFSELPGAESEGRAVAEFLEKRGFSVIPQIHTTASAILEHLHSEGYRVLHLAGHGVHDHEIEEEAGEPCSTCEQPLPKTRKKISGMLIGDNIFLTPGDVEQMRWVPELVFINCCHLGELDGNANPARHMRYSAFAANVGAQFIRMGVKAVIAAGWAVDDAAAETFAISLYTHLLNEDRFGDAVRAAREETFDKHGATNTWGAYQCYGDPSFRLRPPRDQQDTRTPPSYVSPVQAVMDLDNFAQRAKMIGGKVEAVEAMERAITKQRGDWLKRADVSAALGIAYGEVGEFEKAITNLDRALKAGKAEITMHALEERANIKVRFGAARMRKAGNREQRSEAIKLIDEAISDLNRLLEWDGWGTSVQRLNLLGSAYKRKAQIALRAADAGVRGRRTATKEALTNMAACYRRALVKAMGKESKERDPYPTLDWLAEKNCGEPDSYPLINWLTAAVLLEWYDAPRERALEELPGWLQKAKAQADENPNPDFWISIAKADCDLLRALASRSIVEQKDAIVDAYREARRGGSQRQFGSVLEHIEFVAEITAGARGDAARQAAALREIKERLAGMQTTDD